MKKLKKTKISKLLDVISNVTKSFNGLVMFLANVVFLIGLLATIQSWLR